MHCMSHSRCTACHTAVDGLGVELLVLIIGDVPDLHHAPGVCGEEVCQLVLLLSTEPLNPAIGLDGEDVTILADGGKVLVVNIKLGAGQFHLLAPGIFFKSHDASLRVLCGGEAFVVSCTNLDRL